MCATIEVYNYGVLGVCSPGNIRGLMFNCIRWHLLEAILEYLRLTMTLKQLTP